MTNTVVYASFYTAAELSQQAFNKVYSVRQYHHQASGDDQHCRLRVILHCCGAVAASLQQSLFGTAVRAVATKVAADQFIMTPILLATFYTLLGVLERREDVFEELREKYWKTFVANQAFWIPGQTINFFFMPPHLRVVYVASTSFIWINVLCYIKRQKNEKIE
ncbi:putative peroxisomal membrane protein mpv17 [Operophtera brumata]|uniref:Mitochondrial inner membrane protein Mpv17 n=1 Tax=Operophtera brumata TaxID=104452 RepID=A0A0L7LEW2_OPEBR|nr:putative peroxisomal membrane protein mpv17 [Operophtera brumata]